MQSLVKFVVAPLVFVGMVFGCFTIPLIIGWEYARYWYVCVWNDDTITIVEKPDGEV